MTHTDPFDRDFDYERARHVAARERKMAIDTLMRRIFRIGHRTAPQR